MPQGTETSTPLIQASQTTSFGRKMVTYDSGSRSQALAVKIFNSSSDEVERTTGINKRTVGHSALLLKQCIGAQGFISASDGDE